MLGNGCVVVSGIHQVQFNSTITILIKTHPPKVQHRGKPVDQAQHSKNLAGETIKNQGVNFHEKKSQMR